MRFSILFAVAWLLFASSAMSEGRHVLLIGNSEYSYAPLLENPSNDTEVLAQSFERLGYEVTRLTDLTRAATTTALREFRNATTGAETAIIYFAGHGIEVDGKNYMVPTDAALRSDLDVEFEGIPLELLVAAVSGADGLSIVVLDACRDNPFAAQMTRSGGTRSIGRGLGGVEPTRRNQLIAYAAKAGTVAYDGDGDMSPYAAAFNEALQEPGLDVSLFFRQIRDRVMDLTGERQEPFHYGSLSRGEVFISPPAQTATIVPAATGSASTGQPASNVLTSSEKIARDFGFAQQIGTEAAWNSFLEKYGESEDNFYVKLALAALGTAPSDAVAAPAQHTRGAEAAETCNELATDAVDSSVIWERHRPWLRDPDEHKIAISECEAAVAGFPDDMRFQHQLGHSYLFYGSADDRTNTEKAISKFSLAAKGGYAASMYRLYTIYNDEKRTYLYSKEKARRWLERAAEAGNAHSLWLMAVSYQYGWYEFKESQEKALNWHRKYIDLLKDLVSKSDAEAIYRLANEVWDGDLSTKKDERRGFELYERAAELGHPDALYSMAEELVDTHNSIPLDQPRARDALRRAADLGKHLAILTLGAQQAGFAPLYPFSNDTRYGFSTNYLLAIDYLEKASEHYPASQSNVHLARIYGNGLGVTSDPEKAADLLMHWIEQQRVFDIDIRSISSALSSETIRALQSRLRAKGFYEGSIDGQAGPMTRRAIIAASESKN
ncbi:caspase family protein [Roseibium sp.]|uniref:caspase family protein n=1 Tax=Roseibium sp. TaxID=1936156 RepID=UPI003B50FE19